MLDIGMSDQHFKTLLHIAEKYFERALEQYDADKGTADEADTVKAMIHSLTDRLAMVEATALRRIRDLLHEDLQESTASFSRFSIAQVMARFDAAVKIVREEEG